MSASEFESHEALIAELRAGTLDAPDHLHRRVLAVGPGGRARLPMSRRRQGFALVLVAAGLAVGAAVIHGLVNSGSKQHRAVATAGLFGTSSHRGPQSQFAQGATGPQGPTGLAGPAVGAAGPTGAQGPTGLTGVEAAPLGRKYSGSGSTGANGPTGPQSPAGAYTESVPPSAEKSMHLDAATLRTARFSNVQSQDAITIAKNRRVHADASLQVVVPNRGALPSAANQASQIVTSLGGYTQSSQLTSRTGSGYAIIQLRVPVGKVNDAIKGLDKLGHVVSQQVGTQDVTQKISKQGDTIGQLQRAIVVYEQALRSGTLSGSQLVNVQIQLSNAEHQLKATRTARGKTVAYAATSDIQLVLTTNHHHAAVVHPGKRGRLGRLLHDAGGFLGLEAIIVLYALIVAVPFILLGALGWWLLRERRRKEERLLANA